MARPSVSVPLVVTALIALAACSAESSPMPASAPSPISAPSSAPQAPRFQVDVEAVDVRDNKNVLIAGHGKASKRLELWLCPQLGSFDTCLSIGPAGFTAGDYVDDLAFGWDEVLWVLTTDVDRQRSSLWVSPDGGESWKVHPAPDHGLAAGSSARLQVLGQEQALLTTYRPTGPVAGLYRTDDSGTHWKSLGDIDLS